jgi:AbrB family looped-hinge helix DNA binding protein
MKRRNLNVTNAGQVTFPAEVRRRWGTSRLVLEDHDDHVVLRPLPEDPISFARGAFAGRKTADELLVLARRDETAAERPKR